MAVLTPSHYVLEWSNGLSARACLYALRNVTTGDTADLTAEFSVVKQAIMLGTTVVTMPAALAGDGAYLLAWGVPA